MFTFPPAKAKTDARTEYRVHEGQRVEDSQALAQKFPDLNSLSVTVAHFRPPGLVQIGALKLTYNPDHAKSVLRVDCANPECVEGDFDLTAELAKAVSARRKTLSGEIICQGWQDKNQIGRARCQHILRFKLSLGYKSPAIKSRP
jgi:hypothetical protein